MRKYSIFVLGFIFVFSSFVFGQTKVVTNADLEKYRKKRLQAEKDLRENYREMGFPSPEELQKQNEKSRRELNEFADQLREDRLFRESQNTNVYKYNQPIQNQPQRQESFIDYGYYVPNYYYGNYRTRRYFPNNRGNRRFKRNRDFRQRFINNLPANVRRFHRFNQFDTKRKRKPFRRGTRYFRRNK